MIFYSAQFVTKTRIHKVLTCKSKKVTSSAPGKSATNLGKGLHIRIFVLRPAIRRLACTLVYLC